MVSIEEAQQIILEHVTLMESENVSLIQGLNRVTSEDHIAPWDIPPADNSAMDGFAFSHVSVMANCLKVTGFLPAGDVRTTPVPPGEAVKIMTGAPVPPGCDTVVPIEDAWDDGESIFLTGPVMKGSHIRRRGEDILQGSVIIAAGSLLRPQEIGMLSAMGTISPTVYRRVHVAILATGDELLEAGSAPVPGRIINSNSYSLAAQTLESGGVPVVLGIAPDNLEESCEKIKSGLNADMLVITGGISVGDRDFVKSALEELGGEIIFRKVDMKPGRPFAFAMLHGKPVFALPGNPTAAMVSFELFVRPAILKAMGHRRILRPTVTAVLQEDVINTGKHPHLVRGTVTKVDNCYCVSITRNQSSGCLSSLIHGNSLIKLAPESCHSTGESVEVILLDRCFE